MSPRWWKITIRKRANADNILIKGPRGSKIVIINATGAYDKLIKGP